MKLAALILLAVTAHAGALEDIKARIGNFPGTVSLYAKNLTTGKSIAILEDVPVRTASTIKLPVMLTVFDAVQRGKASWTDNLTVTKADKVSGSGVIGNEISEGVKLPLRDVVNLMIVLSDNSATNMIIQRFSADAVNAYMDKLGLPNTRLMRKVRGDGNNLANPSGWSAAGKLLENQKYGLGKTTPKDMVTILERIDKGEIVSPEASAAMLAIMRRCQDETGIRRKLRGYTIANKTGALDALRSDVALIDAGSDGKIAMAITVEGIPNVDYTPENQGSILIADIAKIVVEALAIK